MPTAVGCRIVHGQQLYQLHTGSYSPVHHAPQVAEVAHAARVFAAQGKDGYHHTGRPPRLLLQVQDVAIAHTHLAVVQFLLHHAVVAFLPRRQFVRLVIHHHIFIFYGHRHHINVYRQYPVLLADILHPQIAGRAPAAHCRMAAQQSQRVALGQLGCRHSEYNCFPIERQPPGLHMLTHSLADGGEIGIAVQMGTEGHVAPLVVEDVVLGRVRPVGTRHLRPLLPQHRTLGVLHLIVIGDDADRVLAALQDSCLQRPPQAVLRSHQQVRRSQRTILTTAAEHHVHALAPLRSVLNGEFQFHSFFFVLSCSSSLRASSLRPSLVSRSAFVATYSKLRGCSRMASSQS